MTSIGEKENKSEAVSAYLTKNSKGAGRKRKGIKSLSQAVGRTGRSSVGERETERALELENFILQGLGERERDRDRDRQTDRQTEKERLID